MQIAIFIVGVITVALAATQGITQDAQPPAGQPKTASPTHSVRTLAPEDEKAIRQVVDEFIKSYNNHDAHAIAGLFTVDGMAADDEGNVVRGRKEIERVFATVFKDHPQTKMTNTIESLRRAGPAEAVETGTTTVVNAPNSPADKSRYRVIHVKQNGQWRMAAATELPDDTWGGEAALAQLEGLIGDWVDESPDVLVLTSYRWTDNHRFILGTFTAQIGGKPAMTGSVRIGWDPLKKTIRSWTFDSEGGFAEATWSRHGNTWVEKLNGVTRNGKTATATRTMTQVGKDRMILQTVDRVVGDEKMADGEKILVVRRPPEPK